MEPKTVLRNSFQLIADSVDGDALILLDLEGSILAWNNGERTLQGYTADEIVGQHLNIFYLPKDRQTQLARNLINEAKKKGRAVSIGQKITRNGTIFWGSIEVVSIKDGDAVIGFTGRIAEMKGESDSWHFWFDNEGILHVKAHPMANTPEKIVEFRQILSDSLHSSGKICCVADLREVSITDEGMDFSKPSIASVYKAIAYISNSQVDPVTEKVVSILSGQLPIAVFNARPAAKAWIKQYN